MHPALFPNAKGSPGQNIGHKRKRSESDDHSRYDEPPPYDYSPSKRPEPQHMANRALRAMGDVEQNGTGYYSNGHSVEQNTPNGHSWPPAARPLQPQGSVNGSRPTTSDAQLADALQRETHAQDAQQRPWDSQPNTNGDSGQSVHDRDSPNTINVVGPKRKRNVSNRTKTGCMTCRERKKKCDETHPICEPPFSHVDIFGDKCDLLTNEISPRQ